MVPSPHTWPVSHQTARLASGRHAAPGQGVSVMELASMLAGEPFTDRPRAVCPVVAALLRAYNDTVDDVRRHDLYACAADAVGTRDSRTTRRARLARCERELETLRRTPAAHTWRHRLARRLRRALPGARARFLADLADSLGHTEGGHARALVLVAELVHLRVPPPPPCRVMSGLHVADVRHDPAA